ncbi:hypothetical protein MGG_01398 [Pyricularia oryzae 70-15]|uniref:Rhodopsin domain-containing protein n=1 Tax=Pyricularia oryzae (strain 70-15 / ATCC MYA-4617 / FGSC 8958) TaxID=242507 RepID=G4MZH7_PYRO7|nr:uncharacterized protein MGG_01398 [Pyricularia oryzae 70-15]EHA54536.1 hypothetical protein MGG_01398 [Pyricularia oryzae 70-15]
MANSGDLTPALYAAPASLMALTGLLVGSRTWARLTLTGLRADDVFIIFSWIFNVVLCSFVMALASVGLGTKTGEMSSENYAKYLKLIPVCSISFSFGTALAKCSFAVLYLRLIPNRYVQWLNRGIIFYVLCQAIEETFVNIFQCRPVAKAWDPSLEGTCINIETMWWFGFVSNICTDWILFLEPMPFIWGLQLISVTKKIGLSFMLSLGLLLCIISVKRVVEAAKTTINDGMFLLAEPLIWSIAELSALIICSCTPALRQTLYRIPWLNRALGLGSKLGSDREDRYSKSSSFGASRFFFNRRVRYGRSTSCSGGGVTEVGVCPSQTNMEDKNSGGGGGGGSGSSSSGSSSSKHHHQGPTTETEGRPTPRRHHLLMPPVFWSRSGASRQPMNLRSGIQSNLEVSSIRDMKSRATQSTDYVPSRPKPSESCHDLAYGQREKPHLCGQQHVGMRIIAIEGDDDFDQRSTLEPLESETQDYYTEKPHAESCISAPAPALLRNGRSIPPIKITPAIDDNESILSPRPDPLSKLKGSADTSDSK